MSTQRKHDDNEQYTILPRYAEGPNGGILDDNQYNSLYNRILGGELAGHIDEIGRLWLPRASMRRLEAEAEKEARRAWAAHERVVALMGVASYPKFTGADVEKATVRTLAASQIMTEVTVGRRPPDAPDDAVDADRRHATLARLLAEANMPGRTAAEAEAEKRAILKSATGTGDGR